MLSAGSRDNFQAFLPQRVYSFGDCVGHILFPTTGPATVVLRTELDLRKL